MARYLPNGTLDPTFGDNGLVLTDITGHEDANAVAIQPDGKIVAAGYAFVRATSQKQFAVVRYNTDGSLEDGGPSDLTPLGSFGDGGLVQTPILDDAEAESVVIHSVDGEKKIVLTGWARDEAGHYCIALARYNADGTLDETFGVADE